MFSFMFSVKVFAKLTLHLVATSNRLVSPLAAFQARGLDVTYVAGDTVAEAVAAAKAADVAIIFGSAHSGEGHDRTDLLFYHKASHDAAAAAAAAAAAVAGSNNCSVTAKGIIGSGFFASPKADNVGECCDACYGNAKCVAYTYRTPTRSEHGSAAATTTTTTSSGSCFLKDNATPHGGGEPGAHVSGVIPGRAPGGGARIEDIITAVGAVNAKTIVAAVVRRRIIVIFSVAKYLH